MAHFAKIDQDGIVQNVIVAEQEFIDSGAVGDPSSWIQTSYNTYMGEHLLGGTPLRKNFAGKGYRYDPNRDAFIPPKVFESWHLNEDTCHWEPPVPRPTEPSPDSWSWYEDTLSWGRINRPFANWVMVEDGTWIPPIPKPTEGGPWEWKQEENAWVVIDPPYPSWTYDFDKNVWVAPVKLSGTEEEKAAFRWSELKKDWVTKQGPYPSWILDETDTWVAPIPKPADETPENPYTWNEGDQKWVSFLPK